jgi:hypothetical protein
MRRERIGIAFILGIIFIALFPLDSVRAQVPGDSGASLYDKLKGQYKITKMGLDSTGLRVIDAGTVLVVHGKSLYGTPVNNLVTCTANFQDGNLHPPGGFCTGMVKDVGRYLDDGEKVYVTKIDVNLKKEKVTFNLIECDSCNGVQQPSYLKSAVGFDFPKGYLEGTDIGPVSDIIDQVLAIDSGNGDAQQQNAAPAPAAAPADAAPAPADAAPPAAAAPAPIKIGQSIDEVQANTNNGLVLAADLGDKKIYQYNGLKITFVKGKVTDVQ